jgi:ArsR family transcriptional regulator, arsenate/arsenite/antimonite-responsive transcriptional repressor / arsenate reductase (thioredoxin)
VVARTAQPESDAPSFLRLAGHPIRWGLLSELARSDRRVGELRSLVAAPQSLVSYHLSKLRGEGLVSVRRSSADGRDAYYSLDLVRCGELLAATGGALHPALALSPPAPGRGEPRSRRARVGVLFLCAGNSARSQIAEALLERLSGGSARAFSAGSHPKPLHPNAVRVMRERGIDIAGRRSKHLSEFTGRRLDFVVSLCDRVREVCPEFPDRPDLIHWSIPDPAHEGDSDSETYPAFQRTADELATRIWFLLARIDSKSEVN